MFHRLLCSALDVRRLLRSSHRSPRGRVDALGSAAAVSGVAGILRKDEDSLVDHRSCCALLTQQRISWKRASLTIWCEFSLCPPRVAATSPFVFRCHHASRWVLVSCWGRTNLGATQVHGEGRPRRRHHHRNSQGAEQGACSRATAVLCPVDGEGCQRCGSGPQEVCPLTLRCHSFCQRVSPLLSACACPASPFSELSCVHAYLSRLAERRVQQSELELHSLVVCLQSRPSIGA